MSQFVSRLFYLFFFLSNYVAILINSMGIDCNSDVLNISINLDSAALLYSFSMVVYFFFFF